MTYPSPIQDYLANYKIPCGEVENSTNREGASTGIYQEQLLSEFLPWGETSCTILASAGIVELEYASIQKSCGVFDAACRGTIKVKGGDCFDFIERLSTQKFDNFIQGDSLLAFFVNRQGKIVADTIIHHHEDCVLIDVDITVVDALIEHLSKYAVMEDIQIQDITSDFHWLWLIGPDAIKWSDETASFTLPMAFLGVECKALFVNAANASQLWETLIASDMRPIGWYAINMSRVENRAVMFLIDFDTSSLPHESSAIDSRVSFSKGCYLGQEVIARMHSLGKPKRSLVSLKIKSDVLPIAGSQLWSEKNAHDSPIGVVTSSAISPKYSGSSSIIAMVSKKFIAENTILYVYVGAELFEVTVHSLSFARES